MSLTVSVDLKQQHWTMHTHWSQFVPNMSTRHPRALSSTSSSSTTTERNQALYQLRFSFKDRSKPGQTEGTIRNDWRTDCSTQSQCIRGQTDNGYENLSPFAQQVVFDPPPHTPPPTPPVPYIYFNHFLNPYQLLNLAHEMPLEGTTATRAALPIPAGALVLTCYDAMGIVCWNLAKAAGVTFAYPVALACLVYTASHALASCNNPLLCWLCKLCICDGVEWSKDRTQAVESVKWRPQQAYGSNQVLFAQP